MLQCQANISFRVKTNWRCKYISLFINSSRAHAGSFRGRVKKIIMGKVMNHLPLNIDCFSKCRIKFSHVLPFVLVKRPLPSTDDVHQGRDGCSVPVGKYWWVQMYRSTSAFTLPRPLIAELRRKILVSTSNKMLTWH